MRLGLYLPFQDQSGHWLNSADVAERAKRYEEAGIDGAWTGDHMPLPGDSGRNYPDPLMWLLLAAHATERIELGTCIFCVPLRTPYDIAQRLYTLQTLAPGRFTIGVGTGSQEREYESIGLKWGDRFVTLRDSMAKIRAVFDGGPELNLQGEPGLSRASTGAKTWAEQVGPPRFMLGAWHSEPQLRRAATEYDGWIASGTPGTRFGGWRKVLSEGIERYRALGGRRAMVVNVAVDLSAPTTPFGDEGPFSLACDPDEAARRVEMLAELGYDDLVLRPMSEQMSFASRADLDLEQVRAVRALVPEE